MMKKKTPNIVYYALDNSKVKCKVQRDSFYYPKEKKNNKKAPSAV